MLRKHQKQRMGKNLSLKKKNSRRKKVQDRRQSQKQQRNKWRKKKKTNTKKISSSRKNRNLKQKGGELTTQGCPTCPANNPTPSEQAWTMRYHPQLKNCASGW